jgi:hypothetical protein
MAKRSTSTGAIEGFAEDLGKLLGQARNKAEGWLGQRQAIVKQLTGLRDEATHLLRQLGHEAAAAGRRGRRAVNTAVAGIQKRGSEPVKGLRRKRRKMSAEARAKISAAQKRRWARQRAAKK